MNAALQNYPNLDPKAVLAVASQEGLSGGIGDGGHAFGPFQLNNAGGVITGQFAGQTPGQINQWAWSPQGINYALGKINSVAGGQQGQQAINSIVTGFERPANEPREIAGASAAYGGLPQGGAAPEGYSGTYTPSQGLTEPPVASQSIVGSVPTQQQVAAGHVSVLGSALSQELSNAAQSLLSGGSPNLTNLFALAKNFQTAKGQMFKTPKSPPLGGTKLAIKAGSTVPSL